MNLNRIPQMLTLPWPFWWPFWRMADRISMDIHTQQTRTANTDCEELVIFAQAMRSFLVASWMSTAWESFNIHADYLALIKHPATPKPWTPNAVKVVGSQRVLYHWVRRWSTFAPSHCRIHGFLRGRLPAPKHQGNTWETHNMPRGDQPLGRALATS